jgi:hypothetical protein
MSEELDKALLAYLQDRAEEKHRGVTLEKVYDAQVRLANHFDRHVAKDEERFDHVGNQYASTDRRLVTVEANVANLKASVDDTGEHAIDALTAAAEARGMAGAKHPMRRREDKPPWWRKAVESTVAKIMGILAAGALGYLLHHLARP